MVSGRRGSRSNGVWSQQGNKLVGSGGVAGPNGIGQGFSVALSADGNTAIVGGPGDNADPNTGIGAGAVWVFTRSGGVWTQQGPKLVGNDAAGNAGQGSSVALSADGSTAIVGGPSDNGSAGAVWVFTRSGGVWTQQGPKLVGTGAVGNAEQGKSVTLSGDGNTAIVGGPNDNCGSGCIAVAASAAWVFTRSGGVWTQQGPKLVGNDAAGNAGQGGSVSLSADGNTVIMGGPGDGPGGPMGRGGAAWVFTRCDGGWSQQGHKLVGTNAAGPGASQGNSVALSSDGNTAIVGGPCDGTLNCFTPAAGAAWVFTRSGGVWTQQGPKLVGTGAVGNASQGYSVALSGDGSTAIVGGLGDNGVGAAWVFVSGTATHRKATHDFNGDGMSDILWWNGVSGQVVLWFMNGVCVIGGGSPGSAPPPWTIAGTGDFNGDGYTDILWYNTATGEVVLWFMNGASVIGGGSPGGALSPWTIAQTGDYNGDGFSDLLWYNTATGQAAMWFLNGTSVGGGWLGSMAASPWQIQGMNAD